MLAKDNPLVSIIIPCYNLSGYIEPCLNSCISQTYKNLEIIVINDCSQDNSQDIIDYYTEIDQRITPIYNKKNEGVVNTRCVGIEKSSGEYIFFLDGDDYLKLDAIEKLVEEAINNNADIVVGQYFHEKDYGYYLDEQIGDELLNRDRFIRKILEFRLFTLWAKLFKKELFTESLNYHSELKRGEDLVLIIQLAHNSEIIKGIDTAVYYYRHRGTAVTKSQTFNNILHAYKSRFITENYVIEYGFKKEKDFELGIFICFILIAMIIDNYNGMFLDKSWINTIKEKIKTYLLDNKEFASFYRKNFNKNYWRLKIFYHFSLENDLIFSAIYKFFIIKNRLNQ